MGSPLRNPRQLAEVFSSRHSRAPGQVSRLRATTRGRPYGIRGASAHGLFARFSWRKSFTFSTSASFFPQKQSFCGRHTKPLWIHVSKFAAIGRRFFLLCHPRTGSSVTLAHWMERHVSGRPHGVAPTESAARRHMVFLLAFRPVPPFSHRSKASVGDIRSPYGSTFQNSRHLVKGFSTRHSRALDETSRFEMWILQGSRSVRTRLILLTFPVGKSYATSAVLPLSHRSKASVGALVRFVGKRRRRRPRRRFSQENRANAPSADDGSSVTLAGDHAGSPLRMSISKCEFHRAE